MRENKWTLGKQKSYVDSEEADFKQIGKLKGTFIGRFRR